MTAKKYMPAVDDQGQILVEVVELYAPTEREAALALAAKTGSPLIDLSRAGEGDHLPRVLLFEPDEPPGVIVKAVHEAAERRRRAIGKLQ